MKTKSPGHAQNLVVRVVPEAAVKARRDPTKKGMVKRVEKGHGQKFRSCKEQGKATG